ncbi:signal peptide peptidase SppA [Candidatus Woesearchaeota archaeon]|nr:signal peptide peptidase SppA [Candidatus Woesearchaeota archaeon]
MNKIIKILIVLLAFALVSFTLSNLLIKAEVFDQIAIIQIKGPITSEQPSFPTSKTVLPENIISFLDSAEKDKGIKAVILEINSPGGTAVASKEIASRVKSFNKPVVAWIRDLGTSGAYWVASSADKIIADDLSITGSVGVTSSYLGFSGLFEKFGISYEQVAAGKYKELGSPYKKLEEQERELLMSKINKIHRIFLDEVAENRNLNAEQINKISTGEFFLGSESKSLGLIDYLGSKEVAINVTKQLANLTEASIVTYETKQSLFERLAFVFNSFSFKVGEGISHGFVEETKSANFEAKV